MVDKLSGGRVGYLHIKAMDQPSLAKFKKELGEFRHKEGLVIDERWNGGGNIEQELLAILVQRPYEVWQPRGVEPTERPFTGYFGPKVVLQNWRSASNAEMFPAGFRALGLGKVVGTPTMGAVIGTGSYSLIDGSSIRTPGRRRLPRRYRPDQHGKPRRPARHLRREHPRRQPRRPRPPARNGRSRSHERPEARRVGRQEREGLTVSQYGDKVTTINRRAPLLTGGVRFHSVPREKSRSCPAKSPHVRGGATCDSACER